MGLIKLLATPIRTILRFPLVQLALVIGIILLLQAADDNSAFGQIFNGLDKLVNSTMALLSALFTVKSFTKAGLTTAAMIAYVYLACLLIVSFVRVAIRALVDVIGWSDVFGLRNAIARERGIAAYRAWVPLERIRPANISQKQWEVTFAWPTNNKPPYPPLLQRVLHGIASYSAAILILAVLLQIFTPFSVLTWLGKLIGVASSADLAWLPKIS